MLYDFLIKNSEQLLNPFSCFLDHIIASLEERFLSRQETISTFQYIMPKRCEVTFKMTVEKAFEFYAQDFP